MSSPYDIVFDVSISVLSATVAIMLHYSVLKHTVEYQLSAW